MIRRLPRFLPVLLMVALMLIGLLRDWLCVEQLAGVVDAVPNGQTIRIGDTRIRLHEIAVGARGTRPGAAAQRLLTRLALQQQATCRICRRGGVRNSATGICRLADGTHLERALVEAGLARDCPAVSGGKLAAGETAASKEIPLPEYCRPWMRRGPMPPVR